MIIDTYHISYQKRKTETDLHGTVKITKLPEEKNERKSWYLTVSNNEAQRI